LTRLYQIGLDRRIVLQFGEEDFAYFLIVEFFATGNVILTDKDFKILALLRIVQLESQNIAVGEIYEMPSEVVHEPMTRPVLLEGFQKYLDKQQEVTDPEQLKGFNKKKAKKRKQANLKGALRTIMGPKYGPSLVDQALHLSHLDPSIDDLERFLNEKEDFERLFSAFVECDKIVEECSAQAQKGYIFAEQVDSGKEEEEKQIVYEDVLPFRPLFLRTGVTLLEFASFDKAVDEFFSKVESQRLEQKARQAEMQALKKLEAVRQNNANQIRNFQISQEQKNLMAQAIEFNLDLVDSAIKTVCSFIASGMDWGDLQELIKEEQAQGNRLALSIHQLKLESGLITLSLPDPSIDAESSESEMDETDSEQEEAPTKVGPKPLMVDIDIYQSAYANARAYYDAKKLASAKEQKTIQASARALETAEKKIMQNLQKKEAQVASISKYRTPHWFEKFLWFISTENYLVVGGRDMVQNEQLVMRYMQPGDLFVSADMDGSGVVIVKPLPGNPPMTPHMTLLQAGTMSVCQSRAWEAKIVTSAFWVQQNQLTKVSAAGDSLPTGVFNINGKKNYLPPVQLVYGIGLLFQVDEESVPSHALERKPWKRDGYVQEIDNRAVDLIEGNEDGANNQVPDSNGADGEEVPENPAEEVAEDGKNDDQETAEPDVESSEDLKDGDVEVPDVSDSPEPTNEDGDLHSKEEDEQQDDNKTGSKRLSAKQRRELKKKGLTAANVDAITSKSLDERSESQNSIARTESRQSVASNTSTAAKSAPLPRGKKAKLKKIATKYADQDEEDREMMLELLGSNKGPQPKGKRAKEKAAKEEEKLQQQKQRQQNAPKAPQKKKEKPVQVKDVVLPEVEIPEVNLDDLTGQPNSTDTLLNCIPVCAPWITLQKYKYKLKLLPGSLKRGKAAQQATVSFLAMAKKQFKSESEENLIKGIPDQEWINAMMAKVKIVSTDKK
jgi:predicted ribosome quality control (RQC) complex YloA/Tae2 family protein